jgi:hypothetical protein
MLSSDLRAQIRHWFYAEHWKVGTRLGERLDRYAKTAFTSPYVQRIKPIQ